MKKFVPLFIIALVILSACTSQSPTLTGTWQLIAYGPVESMTPAVSDAESTLTFGDDGTVSGTSGCNSLGGEYQVQANQVTFGEITSTLMACEEDLMAQESAMTQVLNGTAEFEIEDQTLAITSNAMVLVFTSVE